MTSAESVWDVMVDEDTAIVKKTEVEARQVFVEAVSNASRLGYRTVVLRKDGAAVQSWP
jgi:hypothetical protein